MYLLRFGSWLHPRPLQGAGWPGTLRPAFAVILALGLTSCTAPPEERESSSGHLNLEQSREYKAAQASGIPETVQRRPYVPVPAPAPPSETYTVVVNEVPVKELLFAVARDGAINIDVHPDIEGRVTLNAVDQTLPQILDRVSQQVDLRYEDRRGTLLVLPDSAFLRTYKFDYVNMTRDAESSVGSSSDLQAGGGGGGGGGSGGSNTSELEITNTSNNRAWETLVLTLEQIVATEDLPGGSGGGSGLQTVISNPESGVLLVRATAKQHRLVEQYLAQVQEGLHRQVLVEATIVEIELNDRYQSGVDWEKLARDTAGAGVLLSQTLLTPFDPSIPLAGFLLEATADVGTTRQFDLTVRLLKEFGDTRVLSSPKLMVLNNQTAVLRATENEVFFDINVNRTDATLNNAQNTDIDSEVRVVPVGVTMSVTPQINSNDVVTLNIRPTITRVTDQVQDPAAAALDVINLVPVVAVRETETVMRVPSRQIAVLGGLMQDARRRDTDGIPGLSDLNEVGALFEYRDTQSTKSELIIFIRPTVIRNASIEGDLGQFRHMLPENVRPSNSLPTPLISP